MNLTLLYNQQEQKRRTEQTFQGIQLTPFQVNLLNTLKDKARRGEIAHPLEVRAPRQSGKTTVLLKLAEEWNMPLVECNTAFARHLKRQYPHLKIITADETRRLRGSNDQAVLVDEGVDLSRIDPDIRIVTGIHGRYY